MLGLSLDLTTAAGRMMARTVVNFAEYERELISERTKGAGGQEGTRRAHRSASSREAVRRVRQNATAAAEMEEIA